MTVENAAGEGEGEANDHEQRERRNLERRSPGPLDGNVPGRQPSEGNGSTSSIHRLHQIRDQLGQRDGDLRNPPVGATFQSLTAEVHVRDSPWLPPDELRAYYDIDPEFAKGIIETVRTAQQARIDAEMIPIRAESRALLIATTGVTFMPWLAIVAAVILAILGQQTAALITGALGVAGGGVQIIQAVRRPQRAPHPQKPATASSSTTASPKQAAPPKQVTTAQAALPSKSTSSSAKKKRKKK